MAWSLVQSVKGTPVTGSANPLSVAAAFASPVTAGNRIIVYPGCNFTTADVNAPTDSQGNTYTKLIASAFASSGVMTGIWTAVASAAGTLTVTVTVPNASGSLGWTAEEYSGLDASAGSGCLDVAAAGTVATTTAAIDSGTTAATHAGGQLAVSAVSDWGGTGITFTVASGGFTQDSGASISANADANIGAGNKVSASGTAEDCTWAHGGVSDKAVAVIAVIKLAPAGATPAPLVVPQAAVMQAANW